MATTARSPLVSRQRERIFYVSMAALAAAIVLFGFSRSYFLKSFFGSPSLTPLVHLHGFIFSSWIVLFIMQTSLVSAGRTDIHRRLGVVGGILAAIMIVVGPLTAITAVKLSHVPPGAPPLVFLAVPIGDIAVFATLITAGLILRRKADYHKRLMLVATIAILPAPFARFPFAFINGASMFAGAFILTDLLLVASVLYDTIARRRLHPAFLWSGLLLIVSFPLRIALARTDAWAGFATWLTR